MSDAQTRAVIVVFDESTTDTEAALVRNGLHMFKGVQRIIPIRGVPTDQQARMLLSRELVGVENQNLRQQRDELASRLRNAQDAVTGPVPSMETEAHEDPESRYDPGSSCDIEIRAARRRQAR